MTFIKFLIKHPSAWLPIAMSLAALTLTLGYLVMVGIPQQPAEDEGVAAHLFQLLMGGQLPIIAFFAVRYLQQNSKQALQILALQFVAGILACAPVFILEL